MAEALKALADQVAGVSQRFSLDAEGFMTTVKAA